jgi:hypothetical protein
LIVERSTVDLAKRFDGLIAEINRNLREKAHITNPKYEIRNPKYEIPTSNPEPGTRNLEPGTLNPEP